MPLRPLPTTVPRPPLPAATATFLLAFLLLAACDAGAGPRVPSIIRAVGPTALDAVVGTELPDGLSVLVLDEHEAPIAGVVVDWAATAGELGAASTTTGSSGRATVGFRVGTEASLQTGGVIQEVAATVGEVGSIFYFITARAGPLVRVVAEPDTLRLTAAGDSAVIEGRAEDEYGNPIPTLPLAFTSLDADVVTVDDAGLARAVSGGESGVVVRASSRADTVVVVVGQGGWRP